ncbi:hypothetical protein BGZ73_001812 [Actinomortierella ambigua]|nr:hypothetical protein BGZ73_001812 [Actinomortierella ambigua]
MNKGKASEDKDAESPAAHEAEYELAVKIIGGGKPNSIECAAASYFLSLNDASDISGKRFAAFLRSRQPWVRNKKIVLAWAKLKAHASSNEGPFQQAFLDTALLTIDDIPGLAGDETEPRDLEEQTDHTEKPKAKRRRSKVTDDKEGDNSTISKSGSNSSSNGSNNSNSSSSSGSTLTVKRLRRMHDEYLHNFDDYSGLPWLLPSGTNVDKVIHQHVQSLKKESPLHSFVISNVRTVVDLFTSEDRAAVAQELARKKDGSPTTEAETAFMSQYLTTPHATQSALSYGWQSSAADSALDASTKMALYYAMMQIYMTYQQENLKLSTSQSESWYITMLWAFLPTIFKMGGRLDHQPGEVVSEASALRKNVDRDLESRRVHGRKLDGVVSCTVTGLELGAIEAAKADAGPQGTKSLSDSRKLAKVMKDMHDRVAAKASDDIRDKLQTFGLLLARNKVTIYTLRRLPGRHYQLVDDGSYTFPITWDARGLGAKAIVALLARLVVLKKEMEEMADRVVEWTQPGVGGFERDVVVRTMTTPLSSPRND